MMKNKENPIGVYIHIPFCVRKCHYCDFLSYPGGMEEQKRYVRLLVREMANWQKRFSFPAVDTIFIGGGTPSLLAVEDMDVLLQAVADHFFLKELSEFSLECNPGTVTAEKLKLYREAGVSRISIGMQSAVDRELQDLGRIHTCDEFLKCYQMVRRAGFENVNIDVMAAIPGQTIQSYEKTLQTVLSLEPEHISSYSLIIEEGTEFYKRYAKEPPVDEETDRRMYEITGILLEQAGYQRYEISNYAKPHRECRHNLKYWQREEYLGIGLGAASFMEHCRFTNETDMTLYQNMIRNGKCPVSQTEQLSLEDEMSEFMYLGLRCRKGISARQFYNSFGIRLEDRFGEVVKKYVEQGLLIHEGDCIYLTKRGTDVSNLVFEGFI